MPLPSIFTKRTRDSLIRQQGNPLFTRQVLDFLSLDMARWDDDFDGNAQTSRLNVLGYDLFTDGVGGTAPAYPSTLGEGGTIELVTGATDDGYSAIARGRNWSGQRGAVMAVILKMSAITGVKVEVGLHDATGTDGGAATDAGAVNDLAAATYRGTDTVGWIFDTDDTGNVAWQGYAVAADTGITKVEPATIGNYDGDAAPNADTYELLGIALSGTNVKFFRGDVVNSSGTDSARRLTITYESAWQSSGVTATVLLAPWIFAQTRAGAASRTITVDKLAVWQYGYTAE